MENELEKETVQEEQVEQLPATEESQKMDAPNSRYEFPVVGVIIVSVLIIAIIVTIILLNHFGGPIPKPENWWSGKK